MSGTSENIRKQLIELLSDFEIKLKSPDLRNKVQAMIPILRGLRNLGKSLVPQDMAGAARDRILSYLRKYPHVVINGDELLIISGIQDLPRRVR